MSNNNYKIVYSGNLKAGTDIEQFVQGFMRTFKAGEAEVRKLVSAGRPITLKEGLDQATAENYRQAMDKLGMEVNVEATYTADFTMNNDTAPKPDSSSQQAAHDNPYATPQSDVVPDQKGETGVMSGPHTVPAGNGWQWITGGWSYFRRNPFAWIGAIVVWMILTMMVSSVPILGFFATYLLAPVLIAGFFHGANEQRKGNSFELSHLFAGFSNNAGNLVLVGLLNMLGTLAVFGITALISVLMFGGTFLTNIDAIQSDNIDPQTIAMMFGGAFLLAMLVLLLLWIPIAMANWFAPALVALEGVTPIAAMKLSFFACLKNMLPFLIYSLIAFFLMILAMIPLFLGLFIFAPVMMAAIYVSYRDIFYEKESG